VRILSGRRPSTPPAIAREGDDAPVAILSRLDMGCGRVVRCTQFRVSSDGVGMGSLSKERRNEGLPFPGRPVFFPEGPASRGRA